MKRPHAKAFPGQGNKSGYKRHNTGWKTVSDFAGKYGPAIAGAIYHSAKSSGIKSVSTYDPTRSSTAQTSFRGRDGVVKQEGLGGSVSKCVFYNKKSYASPIAKSLMGRQVLEYNGSEQITSGIGRQASNTASGWFWNDTMLTYILPQGPDFATNTAHPTKVLLESFEGEITLTNTRSTNVIVTIYDCIARNDIPSATYSDPAAAWASGETAQGAAATNTAAGSLPYNSEAFNQFYRVVQKEEFILAEGVSHKHLIFIGLNKMWSSLRSNAMTQFGGFKDISCYPLIVIRGCPSNDSTTKSSVSVGTATVDVTYQGSYHYRFPRNTQATIIQQVALPQTYAVGEEVMNEALGVASGNTQA